jgi:hypothetical protein
MSEPLPGLDRTLPKFAGSVARPAWRLTAAADIAALIGCHISEWDEIANKNQANRVEI